MDTSSSSNGRYHQVVGLGVEFPRHDTPVSLKADSHPSHLLQLVKPSPSLVNRPWVRWGPLDLLLARTAPRESEPQSQTPFKQSFLVKSRRPFHPPSMMGKMTTLSPSFSLAEGHRRLLSLWGMHKTAQLLIL